MVVGWIRKVFQASVTRMIDQSRLQHEVDLYRLYLCARYYQEAMQGGGLLPAEEVAPEKAPSYEDQKDFVQAVVDKQVIQMLGAIHSNYDRLQKTPPDPSDIGMPFVLERRQSSIPGAGEGVFLRGSAIPGTVVCLYPGTVYTPLDYKHMANYPNIDKDNDYLMARWDSVVIDGKNPDLAIPPPKENSVEFMLAPRNKKQSRQTNTQHPYALGHLVNHPTPPERPNVSSLPYDYPGFVPEALRPYIPNRYFKKPNILYDNKSVVRGLVLVASTHIENEELFLNYRFNPARPLPKWYVPLDQEADARRWGA
eukprot:comp6827_c1_seq1/m.2573 comp6827_c1_seq1/g.2573  ORF comp6827_c1_seq1/g.2573 comp6827_c1_seq1/m.2573 type:complete len:310 (-) comp6827_c1_seq1:237-1166(-)